MANLGSIHTYRSEVDRIIRFGGSTKETSIRRAVFHLINAYARPRDLLLVEELDYFNPRRDKTVRPDGTLKNILRIDRAFGNRSGLEWVLDQWKEHKISDPTVATKFNTYHFADHKEKVIDLLLRVCTVSIETMKIVRSFPG